MNFKLRTFPFRPKHDGWRQQFEPEYSEEEQEEAKVKASCEFNRWVQIVHHEAKEERNQKWGRFNEAHVHFWSEIDYDKCFRYLQC